jgi:pimeloyl-ACP methyl ester carboxylesterase
VADDVGPRIRAHFGVAPEHDRLPLYRAITSRVLVIGFADDVVMPPHFGAEVAEVLANGRYLELTNTGHKGYVERRDAVNSAILEYFARGTQLRGWP